MSQDKIVKIVLNPCGGDTTHLPNKLYVVDQIFESGEEVQGVDFMTEEQARSEFESSGLEIEITDSHDQCVDCIAGIFGISREEAIEKYAPNYRG